jgi:hypothetical protein
VYPSIGRARAGELGLEHRRKGSRLELDPFRIV